MTTVEEARTKLGTARDLFATGRWDDLYNELHAAYEANALAGAEQGEVAFYLGEACLKQGHAAAAVPYLEAAVQLADVDFSSWAQEELAAARQPGGGEAHAEAAHPAVDVSNHPELQMGSQYPDWVAHAQAKLHYLQYYAGRIDGYFGPVTDAAVKHFQQAWQLPDDGVIGQTTWSALETSAPGVTGTPDGSAHPHATAHPADPHAAPHTTDPHSGVVTIPEQTVEGTPAPVQHWNPETPDVTAPGEAPHEQPIMSEAGEIEFSGKPKIGKSFGPVTVKELVIKGSGKASSEKGKYVAVTLSGGSKGAIKVDTASLELYKGDSWKITLKGSAEISSSSGISGTLEFVNGHLFIEVKFTLVKLDKGEYHFAEITPSVGGKIADEPVHVDGFGTAYLTGKVSVGVTLTPNWEWFAERGLQAAAETTAEVAPAAVGGAEATAAGAEAAEAAPAAGLGAEAIIAGGFIAGAVAVLYVGYANMRDIDALKQLRTDSDKAVEDFAKGFVSAWTKVGAPGGYWGGAGAAAGQKQFDADVHGFEELMRQRHPGQTLDAATMDEVKKMWHETAAQKAGAFEAVAAAMFGKMVRTAIYQAWLKANSDSSLPGDITKTALNYAGIPDGGSDKPDALAGQAAAKNANLQVNIDRWQHALDE